MKYHLLTIALIVFCTTQLVAVPAYPGLITVKQPNNNTLTIKIHGDEHFSYKTTEDGYLVIEDENHVYRYANINKTGEIKVSELYANNVQNRTKKEKKFLSAIKTKDLNLELQQMASKRKVAKRWNKSYPLTGSPKSLVILVNFADKAFVTKNPKEAFTRLLNEPNYHDNGGTGSARDYFTASSNGIFSPEFDVVGPYTLPETMAFYGANANGGDQNPQQMVYDACQAANNDINFADYDTDNDGRLDNVFIYYAGYNEAEGGPATTVWPHRWTMYPSFQVDGVTVRDYACTSELKGYSGSTMCGIGTFVHEFGHVLGLPDFYATNDATHHTLSNWDVMDAGPYNNNGRTPPSYSAYERFYLGYLTPEELTSPQLVQLEPLTLSNKAYLLSKTGTHNLNGKSPSPNEFFLLENRQRVGWDSIGLPGKGMLVTRVYYSSSSWASNTPNNDPAQMGVDIMEADGIGNSYSLSGDPFPGTRNITEYRPALRNGDFLEKDLTYIEEQDVNVAFRFMGGGDNFPSITVDGTLDQFKTVQGTPSATQDITISGTKLTTSVALKFTNCLHFQYKLSTEDDTAWRNSNMSLTPNATDSTLAITLNIRYNPTTPSYTNTHSDKITMTYPGITRTLTLSGTSTRAVLVEIPHAVDATEVTPYSFIANWESAFDATGYYVTAYAVEEGKTSSQKEEFTTFNTTPIPGWYTNFTTMTRLYYNSSPQAITFSNTNDTLITEQFLANATSLKFWTRGISAKGKLKIEGRNGSTWETIAMVDVQNSSSVKEYLFNNNENFIQFRFTFEKTQGSVAVDDIEFTFNSTIFYPAKETFTTETAILLEQLEPNLDFYYKVKATDKSEFYENITDFSNTIHVKTVDGEASTSKKLTVSTLNLNDGEIDLYVQTPGSNLYIYDALGRLHRVITISSNKTHINSLQRGMLYLLKYDTKYAKIIL